VEITRYIHGPGIDEPLAIERKGEIYFYHADGLGSIMALTDSKQKVVESYSYSSFGEIKRRGDKVKNTYMFTAREWDEEIGLYYYRARYYEPTTSRFISFDPAIKEYGLSKNNSKCVLANQPKKMNGFNYADNNPINYTDPFGEAPWYGNYCGPGNNYPLAPIDSLDSACKVHDDCYTAAGLSAGDVIIPPLNPKKCAAQDACDDALCSSARNFKAITVKQKMARITIMGIFCD